MTNFQVPCTVPKELKHIHNIYTFWYRRLFDFAVNIRRWENLPPFINPLYLEYALNVFGFVNGFKHNDKLYMLQGTVTGRDEYYYPKDLQINNYILGELKFTNNIDGVFLPNNSNATPILPIISKFAEQLARLELNIKINLDNCKLSKVFYAESDEQAQKVRKLIDDIVSGKLAVVTNGDNILSMLNTENGFKTFSLPTEYMVDKLTTSINEILNQFYISMGVNCNGANTIKKERNTNEEVNANNQAVKINGDYWIKPLNYALTSFNKIFDTDIKVSINDELKLINESGEE